MKEVSISVEQLATLEEYKNNMLLNTQGLFILREFRTEERIIKHWFKPDTNAIFLTYVRFDAYHQEKRVWGILDSDFAIAFAYFYAKFSKSRDNWLAVRNGIEALGIDLVWKDTGITVKNQE